MLPTVRVRAAALLLLVPLLPVACDRSAVPQPAATAGRDSAARAPRDTAAMAPAAVDTSHAELAVDGEGLRLVLVRSGATRPLAFGASRRVILAAVTASHHGEAPELGENIDCRATVATWRTTGLQLWFATDRAERFIGWSLGGVTAAPTRTTRVPAPTTMSGIGIGSSRTALEDAYAVQRRRSTLGIEFAAGGLAGLLASERGDARITHLWAGQVCLAR